MAHNYRINNTAITHQAKVNTKKIRISVAIITKNRSSLLTKCLTSIQNQSELPDEVIIIDNNSTDATLVIARKFAGASLCPTHIISETRVGYPVIYNRGLQEAKYNWVAFIDDDCTANISWVASIRTAIKKYPSAAAILGLSETQYPQNPYSFVSFFLNYIWKENGRVGERVILGEILDNKNIVYNKRFLRKHSLQFDEHRTVHFAGASEDCDLGARIVASGGICFYRKSIRVKHGDPTSFLNFIRKYVRSYSGYLVYQLQTMGSVGTTNAKKIRLRWLLPIMLQTYRYSFLKRTGVYIIICIIILIQQMVRLWINLRYQRAVK
jgi:glycosyltransferase involved in cell wall biosynthesis